MSSVLLSAKDLKLAYGNQVLLDGVSLTVAPGEKVGLVGRNGCGKTSLFKILAKETEPDSGEISLRRGVRVGYLPQEFELDGTKTVLENIEAGAADLVGWMRRYEAGDGHDNDGLLELIQHADGWNLQTRIKAEAGALAAPPLDAIVGPLSGGEKRRVALCRALASQPDLLLLDEPTNHLDSESIRWLEDFLRGFPGALIFVTHDRYFLETIATRIIEISGGRAFSHPGNYTAFLEAKALRKQIAEQSERRRQRFLRAELEYVRAGVRAQRSKSKHRLDSFYKVAGMEAPPEEREMDLLIPPAPEIGNTAVEFKGVGVRAGGNGRWLFRNLNLSLRAGQCTGVVGRNGVGKTTLLRLCLGELEPAEGTATVGKRIVFNYIDQSRMQLDGKGTVMDEVSDSGEMVAFGDQTLTARAYLRRFLFDESRVKERVDKLSGGERARLLLAKVLRRGGNAIILDEPTNDLDLASLRMLEEALADFDGTILVVSHDRYFLDRICDQIVAFEDGGVYVQPGNYSYYLEKKKERDSRAQSLMQVLAPAAPQQKPTQKPKRLSYKEQKELDGMEESILAAEKAAAEIEASLNDPEFFVSRAAEAPALVEKLADAKSRIARLYERWDELAQRV